MTYNGWPEQVARIRDALREDPAYAAQEEADRNPVRPDLLDRLLADPDPRVRRALDETAGYVPHDPTAFDW